MGMSDKFQTLNGWTLRFRDLLVGPTIEGIRFLQQVSWIKEDEHRRQVVNVDVRNLPLRRDIKNSVVSVGNTLKKLFPAHIGNCSLVHIFLPV